MQTRVIGTGNRLLDKKRQAKPNSSITVKAGSKMNPVVLAYAMGPIMLGVVFLLRRYRLLDPEPVWVWPVLIAALITVSVVVDRVCLHDGSYRWPHLSVGWNMTSITIAIYFSGWGSVMVAVYTFVALENLHRYGSRCWRVAAIWTTAGVAAGQLAIWQRWAPTMFSIARSEVMGLLGWATVMFVLRMAGAIWEQKELAEASMAASEERFRSLVQHSSDTTVVVAPDRSIIYASPATVSLMGMAPEDVIGTRDLDIVHPDDRQRIEQQLGARIRDQNVTDPVQFRLIHADGKWRHVEAVVSDLTDRPAVGGFVVNIRDITDRKAVEELLAHQALHDPLTGLPNRTLILDRATQMLARARRRHESVAALFIDLDNFKDINDTLGHQAGDLVLQCVAERFSAVVRASDTVGRLGGDEFVVMADGHSIEDGPEVLAARLQEAVREPLVLEGYDRHPISLSASIGIASGDRITAEELLRQADIALYRAKAAGKDCCAVFDREMQAQLLDRLELKVDLGGAIERNEFFLVYQPLFHLDTANPCGVEALLRWQHPTRGVVNPDEFLPGLEESGMIVEVGGWVLKEACRQAAEWHRRGHQLTVSVNVSARQLESGALASQVASALASSGIAPEALVIEVAEKALMRGSAPVADHLRAVKELGVLIAVDDFGTGYSSLAHLRQFPVDALKIDRSFVSAMANSTEAAAMVHTLVQLGRKLGLETLAEGIEDRAQLERLRAEHCDMGQGFLFSKPISAEAIRTLLCELATRSTVG